MTSQHEGSLTDPTGSMANPTGSNSAPRSVTSKPPQSSTNSRRASIAPDDEKVSASQGQQKYNPNVSTPITIFVIISASYWGVLARRGLTSLTTYKGSYLSGVIWANFAACVVMGVAVESASIWSVLLKSYPSKAAIPVYTGLSTGFCGTLSSFSSLILEAYTKSADSSIGITYHYPTHAYGIMQFLAVIAADLAVSSAGYTVGRHVSRAANTFVPAISWRQNHLLEAVVVVAGLATLVVDCVLIGIKSHGTWRSWTFSVLFAPFGAVLRYYLSKLLNAKVPSFPLGTFAANVLGTLVLAILTLLARGKHPKHHGARAPPLVANIWGCHILTGLDDGFCGGLTTISTFIVELYSLATGRSYIYGFASIVTSFALVVLVLGSYQWAVGLTDPVCK